MMMTMDIETHVDFVNSLCWHIHCMNDSLSGRSPIHLTSYCSRILRRKEERNGGEKERERERREKEREMINVSEKMYIFTATE